MTLLHFIDTNKPFDGAYECEGIQVDGGYLVGVEKIPLEEYNRIHNVKLKALTSGELDVLFDEYENNLKDGSLEAMTAEEYDHYLNVLPPMDWITYDVVESFLVSEFHTGFITMQCAKYGDLYASKLVNYKDKEDRITVAEILAANS